VSWAMRTVNQPTTSDAATGPPAAGGFGTAVSAYSAIPIQATDPPAGPPGQ
jgi:hypothetical protein